MSSLDYLLASFDEDPAPRPSSTMAAFPPSRHCYDNRLDMGHSWMASSASSDSLSASASATTSHDDTERTRQLRSHHDEQPRASRSGVAHSSHDSRDALGEDSIHGGFDCLFGYPAGASSSFGYQPQSQRVRTLLSVEGYRGLDAMPADDGARESERAAGGMDSDHDLGEDDGESIATIDFSCSDEESSGDDDNEVAPVPIKLEEATTRNERPPSSSQESAGGRNPPTSSHAADALRQWLAFRSDSRDAAFAADALRQWRSPRSANTFPNAANSVDRTPSVAAAASLPAPSGVAVSGAPPTAPSASLLPSRVRRQAAIHCLERISAAIATHGMGGYHSSDDDDEEKDDDDDEKDTQPLPGMEDCKPTANTASISNRIRKRNHTCKTLGGKKRKCEEEELEEIPPTKLPEESESPSPCCICLEVPTPEDLASISGCSHPFCFGCIEKWAERENTCPLCKARFLNIERVNFSGTKSEKSKKVSNRDQRTDFSFMNSLSGIGMFANLDTDGTWPTHIAQLLFSGLGASSLHEGFGEASRTGAPTRPNPNYARVERVRSREREAASGIVYPPHVGFSSRRPASVAAVGTRRTSARATTNREPFHDFLDRVNAHRQQQEQIQRIRENAQQASAFASAAAAAGVGGSSTSTTYRHTFAPFHHATTTRRTTTTTTTERSSPWMFSQSSIHAPVGPHSPSQMAGSSAASPLAFSPFGSPSSPTSPATSGAASSAAAASNDIAHSSILGNPFASINVSRREDEEEILSAVSPSSYIQRLRRELERTAEQREEEEEILSAISPSTYIQRLRRELERTSDQFQFSASMSTTTTTGPARRTSVTSFNPGALRQSTFLYSSVRPLTANLNLGEMGGSIYENEAGRSAETALEIDDSDSDDDDVVEVLAVEAMM